MQQQSNGPGGDEAVVTVRRVHYALTGLFVAVTVLLQLLLFVRSFHVGFVLVCSTGFTLVLTGIYVGIMASNMDHLVDFAVGHGQARVIVWTSVVALIFTLLAALQTVFLLQVPPLTAAQAAAMQVMVPATGVDAGAYLNVTMGALETVLQHHIHVADSLVLCLLLVLFGGMALLQGVSVIVYARVLLYGAQDTVPHDSAVADAAAAAAAQEDAHATHYHGSQGAASVFGFGADRRAYTNPAPSAASVPLHAKYAGAGSGVFRHQPHGRAYGKQFV